MKRVVVSVGLGIVGVVFALGLTVGALAVAGPDVGEPPLVPVFDTASEPSPTATVADPGKGDGKDDDRPGGKNDGRDPSKPNDSLSSTPAPDDRSGPPDGGGTGDDSRSDDDEEHSGSEDHEEPDDD